MLLVFILFYIGAMIGNLVNEKTTTSKMMEIIDLSINLLFVLISFAALFPPAHLTFEESGGLLFNLWCHLFGYFIFFVQSVKYQRMPVKKK